MWKTKLLIAVMILSLTALACSLSGGGSEQDRTDPKVLPTTIMQVPSPTPFQTQLATQTPIVSLTPTTEVTEQVPADNLVNNPDGVDISGNTTLTTCWPRADWPIYVAASGDTLASVARRSNTTITDLAVANCMSNPNMIFVGQQLHVPRIPVTVVPPTVEMRTCPPLNEQGTGEPFVNPVIFQGYRCLHLAPFQPVTVSWNAVPDAVFMVEYYFLRAEGTGCGQTGDPDVIGADHDMTDGNAITWTVGSGPCGGILYAFGYSENGMVESRQEGIFIP